MKYFKLDKIQAVSWTRMKITGFKTVSTNNTVAAACRCCMLLLHSAVACRCCMLRVILELHCLEETILVNDVELNVNRRDWFATIREAAILFFKAVLLRLYPFPWNFLSLKKKRSFFLNGRPFTPPPCLNSTAISTASLTQSSEIIFWKKGRKTLDHLSVESGDYWASRYQDERKLNAMQLPF